MVLERPRVVGISDERQENESDEEKLPRYEFRDNRPIPEPAENEVLIRVKAVGFCYPAYYDRRVNDNRHLQNVPSHVSVGFIERFGTRAQFGTPCSVGDRVGVARSNVPCGFCNGCQLVETVRGDLDSRACAQASNSGNGQGDITEYVLARVYSLVSLPIGLEFDQAALLLGAGVSLPELTSRPFADINWVPIWESMFRANLEARLCGRELICVYGSTELAVLATQTFRGAGYRTITIDAKHDGFDMPCDLNLTPHLRMRSTDPLLGIHIMAQTKECGAIKMMFCEEATSETRRTLQRMCQHQSMNLGPPDEFIYHARDNVLQRDVHHVLQSTRPNIESFLQWVQQHRIMSRVECVNIRDAEGILQKLAKLDIDGFLVVSM